MHRIADGSRHDAGEPVDQASRTLRNAVEYRLHVGRRTCDDLQDLRSRRLSLQRLFGLVEQAHVLDRDHGLVSKGFEQIDVVLRHLAGLVPGNVDDARRRTVFEHRHGKPAPPAARLRCFFEAVPRISQNIFNHDWFSRQNCASAHGAFIGWHREQRACQIVCLRRLAAHGSIMDQAAVIAVNMKYLGSEQPRHALEDDLQHGRYIVRGFTYHPQDLTDCSLVFERFGQVMFLLFQLRLQLLAVDRGGETGGKIRKQVQTFRGQICAVVLVVRNQQAQRLIAGKKRRDCVAARLDCAKRRTQPRQLYRGSVNQQPGLTAQGPGQCTAFGEAHGRPLNERALVGPR